METPMTKKQESPQRKVLQILQLVTEIESSMNKKFETIELDLKQILSFLEENINKDYIEVVKIE